MATKEQIRRVRRIKGICQHWNFWLNPEIKNFYDFDNAQELKDIKVLKYKHHGPIKFKISQ